AFVDDRRVRVRVRPVARRFRATAPRLASRGAFPSIGDERIARKHTAWNRFRTTASFAELTLESVPVASKTRPGIDSSRLSNGKYPTFQASAASMAPVSSRLRGSTFDSKRARRLPCLSIRNLLKFQVTSPFWAVSHW